MGGWINPEPNPDTRCCYNCQHWHKRDHIHCQHSGPFGGDIEDDPNCNFETKQQALNFEAWVKK